MRRIILLFSLCAAWAHADVRLPAVISDHMLIQRDMPVRIWGWADPAERISVRFAGQSVATAADNLGHWFVFLAPVQAGGPHELTVQGKNTITVRDVLAGDVWVASGQSNMGFTLARAANAKDEIAAARYPNLRLFKVALKTSDYPLDDVKGSWAPCSPETVPNITAVGYFFGRDLHKKLNIPIGILESDWGGTPADAWTSMTALAADPALLPVFANWAQTIDRYPLARERYELARKQNPKKRINPPAGPGHQHAPSVLYNAMIAPITPYAIRGVIWYQGESNAGSLSRALGYRRLFPAMIQDWRRAWSQGDFPFLFVQLANFKTAATAAWPELREAQTMTLRLANTGMAVTIDIGNPVDIHPTDKQDVGNRLALAARAVAYGEKLVYSGPLFRQATSEPHALRVWFDHTGGGLVAKGGELRGFTVAGADGKFVPAQARIDGKTIVVTGEKIGRPVYVRYAWADNPECNLYNAEGLPASPFRNDSPQGQ